MLRMSNNIDKGHKKEEETLGESKQSSPKLLWDAIEDSIGYLLKPEIFKRKKQ